MDFQKKAFPSNGVIYGIRAEFFFGRIAMIWKYGNEYFPKTLEDYISRIKKFFAYFFTNIFKMTFRF